MLAAGQEKSSLHLIIASSEMKLLTLTFQTKSESQGEINTSNVCPNVRIGPVTPRTILRHWRMSLNLDHT